MPYCLPLYWPALTMNGFRYLKFVISFGSHGCTNPLAPKYFVQPTYGRKMSGLRPACRFRGPSGLFRIVLNRGLVAGVRFDVLPKLRRPAVVSVAGPIQALQPSALGGERGPRQADGAGRNRRTARGGRQLEELFP